ncbi:MAG: hypothetical protein ACW98K_15665 [Candidatus Kariarchaeaceae archaeon]|jgi:hypothetical protein
MIKPPFRDEYLSSKTIIKGLITFIIFRYGNLTAKQIQSKLGLKKQTTYNYLKEMQKEGSLGVEYTKVETRPNVSVANYFVKKTPPPSSLDVPLSQHHKESFSVQQILRSLNTNIAALLELRAAFQRMTNEEISAFIKCDPVVWGFYGFTYLLTDEEYGELQIEFKQLIDKLDKKWKDNQPSDVHSGNVFTFSFYKSLE